MWILFAWWFLKSSGADPSAPRESGIAAFGGDVVLGPQDGTSQGTGSGPALNRLTEETLYHLFDSPLGRLPSQARIRLPRARSKVIEGRRGSR